MPALAVRSTSAVLMLMALVTLNVLTLTDAASVAIAGDLTLTI